MFEVQPAFLPMAHTHGLLLVSRDNPPLAARFLDAAASIKTCRDFPGSQGHEAVDAATFAEWGADFAKLDSCGGVLNNGTESWDEQYSKWSAALNASVRSVVFA